MLTENQPVLPTATESAILLRGDWFQRFTGHSIQLCSAPSQYTPIHGMEEVEGSTPSRSTIPLKDLRSGKRIRLACARRLARMTATG